MTRLVLACVSRRLVLRNCFGIGDELEKLYGSCGSAFLACPSGCAGFPFGAVGYESACIAPSLARDAKSCTFDA